MDVNSLPKTATRQRRSCDLNPIDKFIRLVKYTSDFYRAMLAVSVSARLSQVGVLLKRLNGGSQKQHHTIPQRLYFSDTKDLREIRPGSPPTRAPNAGGVGQNRRLSTNSWLYLEDGTR